MRVTHPRVVLLIFAVSYLLPPPAAAQAPAEEKQGPWWERISFGGDLRGRYEGFFQEGQPDRNRERFRLRLNVRATLRDDLRLTVRLASGDPGDPTSTNQSFGELLSRKPIFIDQVALVFTPRALGGLTIGGGKFGHPVLRTQMTWDDDINWEGTYQQVTTSDDRPVSLRLTAIQSPLDELSGGPDAYVFAEQAMATVRRGGHRFDVAVASYGFREVDRIAIALATDVLRTKNTNALRFDEGGAVVGYASRFHMLDVIARATLETGWGPIVLLADWVTNTRADEEDNGVWLTAEYGDADEPWTWSAAYTYTRLEREAALAAYMFSDLPGTNTRAHIPELSLAVARGVFVDFTGLLSRQLRVPAGSTDPLLTRIQVDVRVNF